MNSIMQRNWLPTGFEDRHDPLSWSLRGQRQTRRAAALVRDMAAWLPLYVPEERLLILDWELVGDGGNWRAQPRLDNHSQPWLALPASAVRPTGAVMVSAEGDDGERTLTLEMPAGRAGRARVLTLASGMMRMSMQAHDARARFLPAIMRSDLAADADGNPTLHLNRLDGAALEVWMPAQALRRQLVSGLAERVLALMSIPGGGREQPMMVADEAM